MEIGTQCDRTLIFYTQIFKVPEELFKTELQFSATDPRGQLRRANSLDAMKALISGSKSMMSAQKLGEKIWKSRRQVTLLQCCHIYHLKVIVCAEKQRDAYIQICLEFRTQCC